MSRARSVPAFIVAKSAPWMNGTASSEGEERVRREARQVRSARRPPALTASSSSGKTSGETTFAGWRIVRTTERRASCDDLVARALVHAGHRGPGSTAGSVLVACALERAARLGEEDVVERRAAWSWRLREAIPSASRARTIVREVVLAGVELHRDAPWAEPARLAEALEARAATRYAIAPGRRGPPRPSAARSRPSAPRASPRRRSCRGR